MVDLLPATSYLLIYEIAGFSPIPTGKFSLFEQDHPFDLLEAAGLESVEVDAGGHRFALFVGAVPEDLVAAGCGRAVDQGADQPALNVKDIEAQRAGLIQFRQVVGDGR